MAEEKKYHQSFNKAWKSRKRVRKSFNIKSLRDENGKWIKRNLYVFEVLFKVDPENKWRSEITEIQNILNAIARDGKSESTRRSYLHYLSYYMREKQKTLTGLLSLTPEEAGDLITKYSDELRSRGLSISSSNMVIDAFVKFYRANGYLKDTLKDVAKYVQRPSREKGRKLEGIEDYDMPSETEYIPKPEEAYAMAIAPNITSRDRWIIYMLWTCGLREDTLRALQWKHVKFDVEKGIVPSIVFIKQDMKEVLPNACKGKVEYYTFMPKVTVQAFLTYLEDLKEYLGVDELDDNQLLCIGLDRHKSPDNGKRPIGASVVDYIIKRAAYYAGIKKWELVHPHVLRKTYEGMMRSATAEGERFDTKTQEFLMGHILEGAQDAYYDKSKIEEIRKIYANLLFTPEDIARMFKAGKRLESLEQTISNYEKRMKELEANQAKEREEYEKRIKELEKKLPKDWKQIFMEEMRNFYSKKQSED